MGSMTALASWPESPASTVETSLNLADEATFSTFLIKWAAGSQEANEWEGDASSEQFWRTYFEPDCRFSFDGLLRDKQAIKFWLAQDRALHAYRIVNISSFVSTSARVACSYIYAYTETEDGEKGAERFAMAMITADLHPQTGKFISVSKLTRPLDESHSQPAVSSSQAADQLERELHVLAR